MPKSVRGAIVRLAYHHPNLRPQLIPILKQGGFWSDVMHPVDGISAPRPEKAEYIRPTPAQILHRGPSSSHDIVFGALREIMVLLTDEYEPELSKGTIQVLERVTKALLLQAKKVRQDAHH